MAKKDKGDKKRKHSRDAAATEASGSSTSEGFSLFGTSKDAGLDSLFAKSAEFALPSQATASTASKPLDEAEGDARPAKKAKTDKTGHSSKDPTPTKSKKGKEPAVVPQEGEGADTDSDSPADLVHESLKPAAERRKRDNEGQTKKYVPPDETPAQREARTVFVGNVGVGATSKSGTAALKRHILGFATGAKIESVRFRSVAFSTPTAPAPREGEETAEAATRRAAREKERAAAWREQAGAGSTVGKKGNVRGDDEVVDKSKSFLDARGKRKVAFIKGDFHSEVDSCNAYIVFAYAHPDRSTNVAPITPPAEAAATALDADGSEFMGRTIRVTPAAGAGSGAGWLPAGTDARKSAFVGGLDYAAKEEDVRAFFEALITAERGEPLDKDGHKTWVTGVRIVRDRDTQLGKGFGYVSFVDAESVDELVAVPSAKLKFAKKPLRVQPCRQSKPKAKPSAAPGAGAKDAKAAKGAIKGKTSKPRPAAVPKGDPTLGDRLKNLSKDERKAAKASDADRNARRLAKKQAKVVREHTETGKVKLAATKAEKTQRAKKVVAKKGRVRSAHALSKMKGKRGD